jgi:hypothetical protein
LCHEDKSDHSSGIRWEICRKIVFTRRKVGEALKKMSRNGTKTAQVNVLDWNIMHALFIEAAKPPLILS